MNLTIHRGSKEIGGSCVEVESQGQRLLIDIGLPLIFAIWRKTQASPNTNLLSLIPNTVVLGNWTIDVSVYATPEGAISTSAPYELLPLIKLK